MVLLVYDYEIEYKRFEDYVNCDVFLRLLYEDFIVGSEGVVYSVSVIDDDFLIIVEDIGKVIFVDFVFGKVY